MHPVFLNEINMEKENIKIKIKLILIFSFITNFTSYFYVF